jgi:hypothetical protein
MTASEPAEASGQEMTIVGLVGSCAGTRDHYDLPWKLLLRFFAWRDASATVHRKILWLLSAAEYTNSELGHQMNRFPADSIVRVRIRLREDFSGELLELLAPAEDEELAQIREELNRRIVYPHPRFGDFVLRQYGDVWSAAVDWVVSVTWAGSKIWLDMPGDRETGPDARALETTTTLWDNQADWNQRIKDYAVQELQPGKNRDWLDYHEPPVSPAEFRARMKLETISIDSSGGFAFYFDDGFLFFDRNIRVTGDLENGPTNADIPG